jgi:hypothetical protein
MALAQCGVHPRAARRSNGGASILPVILRLCEADLDLRPGTTGESRSSLDPGALHQMDKDS